MTLTTFDALTRDVRRWYGKAAGRMRLSRVLRGLLLDAGLQCVLLYRLQQSCQGRYMPVAHLVSRLNLLCSGADIVPGFDAGPGLLMRHPVGIVLGRGARVGRDCTLLQGVTLGERYLDGRDGRYPVLDDEVTVASNAIILGAVTIGHGATVGANSVVLSDVPAGRTVVGAPARLIDSGGVR